MPIISFPVEAYERAIELAGLIANASPVMVDWYEAETAGFFSGLRCCLPSEAVGLLVMEHDDALEATKKEK